MEEIDKGTVEVRIHPPDFYLDSTDNYNGKYKFSSSRGKTYFVGSSSIPLKKGEGYYQNILLSSNLINYGVSDHISIGGGVDLVSILFFGPAYYFTPKVGYEVAENIHIGGGLMAVGIYGESIFGERGSDDIFSFAYGQATFGSEDFNVSVGAGPYVSHMIDDPIVSPAYILSGYLRISNGVAIIAENYFIQKEHALTEKQVINENGIYGLSFLSRKFSFDVGVAVLSPETYGSNSVLPYLSYVRLF